MARKKATKKKKKSTRKTWLRYRKQDGRFAKKGSTKKKERARRIEGSGAMKTWRRGKR
tara:strand:+ start:555 stop:728 length:174 start_codon:yes stop_codon:yes gene_type:complete